MTPPINSVSPERLDELAQWAASEEADCLHDDMPISAGYYADIIKLIAARRAANTPVDGVAWEQAARTFLSGDDFETLQSLAVAFAEDQAAGVDTSLKPASPALPSQVVGVSIEQMQAAHVERQEEWCPDQKPDLSFRGNEMAGEVGEACNVIKKLERERHGWRGSRDTLEHLGEELADVVHTAILCAITAGIDLGPYVVKKFNDTSEKNGLKSRIQSCLTSPAAEPVGIVVAEDDDLSVYWYEGFAVSEGDELYTHPAPSASREVTGAAAELIRRVRDVLDELGPGGYLLPAGAVKTNYLEAACNQMSALLAALPERESE